MAMAKRAMEGDLGLVKGELIKEVLVFVIVT